MFPFGFLFLFFPIFSLSLKAEKIEVLLQAGAIPALDWLETLGRESLFPKDLRKISIPDLLSQSGCLNLKQGESLRLDVGEGELFFTPSSVIAWDQGLERLIAIAPGETSLLWLSSQGELWQLPVAVGKKTNLWNASSVRLKSWKSLPSSLTEPQAEEPTTRALGQKQLREEEDREEEPRRVWGLHGAEKKPVPGVSLRFLGWEEHNQTTNEEGIWLPQGLLEGETPWFAEDSQGLYRPGWGWLGTGKKEDEDPKILLLEDWLDLYETWCESEDTASDIHWVGSTILTLHQRGALAWGVHLEVPQEKGVKVLYFGEDGKLDPWATATSSDGRACLFFSEDMSIPFQIYEKGQLLGKGSILGRVGYHQETSQDISSLSSSLDEIRTPFSSWIFNQEEGYEKVLQQKKASPPISGYFEKFLEDFSFLAHNRESGRLFLENFSHDALATMRLINLATEEENHTWAENLAINLVEGLYLLVTSEGARVLPIKEGTTTLWRQP